MNEADVGRLLIDLAALFAASYLLGAVLARIRIPVILGALFVGMAARFTPFADDLTGGATGDAFGFLANLGVLFLLFYIGLQMDVGEMRRASRDVVWLTVLNTALPFVFGVIIGLAFGYGATVAFVIGLTRMPTAEAVVVPIVDEFGLIRTRVGQFIVGTGVLDDVIEVFLVAFVSVWIGAKAGTETGAGEVTAVAIGVVVFAVVAYAAYRWVFPWLDRLLPHGPRNLTLLTVLGLFALGGVSTVAQLGLVVGAIVAGVALRPVFTRDGDEGDLTEKEVDSLSYGFLGPIFFLWIGLNVDLGGLIRVPALAILLFLAAFVGKIVGVFGMVPMGKMTKKEALTVGVGINARLTTEIIVAQLLLTAGLIDERLFTALVAASSLSTLLVPPLLSLILARWGPSLRGEPTRTVEVPT